MQQRLVPPLEDLARWRLASWAAPDSRIGSDHQDTPEVELNPKQDMTDVYAFPGSDRRGGSCW